MKAFRLDEALAGKPKSSFPSVRGCMRLRSLRARGCWKEKELAVREHAIYVKKKQFDPAGAGLGGIWHARILAEFLLTTEAQRHRESVEEKVSANLYLSQKAKK
jgi:hypothetical protein